MPNIMAGLKSRDPIEREAATAEAIALGVDPRLVLSAQFLNKSCFRRQSEKLPDLEKRARLLSAEYRDENLNSRNELNLQLIAE